MSDEELLAMILENWRDRRQGYRSGVVLVPVPPEGFFSATRVLNKGDRLVGEYKTRRKGEVPRKTLYVQSDEGKTTPVSVDVVLYRKEVLAEGGEKCPTDWSVITILGKLCGSEKEEPMDPNTLMANHFQDSGGTATGMSPQEFEEALRKSYFYWRNKASVYREEEK